MSYDYTKVTFLASRDRLTEALLEAARLIGSQADPIAAKLELIKEL